MAQSAGTGTLGTLRMHGSAMTDAARRLCGQWRGTVVTSIAVGLLLAVPAVLGYLQHLARTQLELRRPALEISVFLRPGVPDGEIQAMVTALGRRPDVDSVRSLTAVEAAEEFRQWSGLGNALDALGRNPLPATVLVRPYPADVATATGLTAALRSLAEVDQVRFDERWAQRFVSLQRASTRILQLFHWLLGGAVALSASLIVWLTLVSHLGVDRSTGHVAPGMRSLAYEGAGRGLLGGGVGALALTAAALLVRAPLQAVEQAYGQPTQMPLPSGWLLASTVVSGVLLGILAAVLAGRLRSRDR